MVKRTLFNIMFFLNILNVFNPFKLSTLFLEFWIFKVEFCVCFLQCFEFILIILALFPVKSLNFVNFLQEFVNKLTHFLLQSHLIYKQLWTKHKFTLWIVDFEGVSEECIFDELGVDVRHFKIHDSAYLLDVVLLLLLTDVPRFLFIFVFIHLLLARLQRIRIVKGLLS